jgi:hypothetical protein
MPRPLLYIGQILKWADAHRRRTGDWPSNDSGRVVEAPDEKWANVDQALRKGLRGLPGRSSLPRLLAERRGHRNRKALPPFTLRQILTWTDSHHRRTKRWPISSSGPIQDAPGESWWAVDMALRKGLRGMPGGLSLAMLLADRRGVRNRKDVPRLSFASILRWADAHCGRTGNWPTAESGAVLGTKGETWTAIDLALKTGARGLRGRSSLFKLLAAKRGMRRHVRKPPLRVRQIQSWARAFRARTGRWPTEKSGRIPGTLDETWCRVAAALRDGRRGLPAGLTLAEFRSASGR